MKKKQCRLTAFLLTVVLSFALVFPALPSSVSAETPYAEIITVSDFQSGGFKAFSNFSSCLSKAAADGIGTPDGVIFGGDYSTAVDSDPTDGIQRAKNALKSVYPNTDEKRITVVQGNHDLAAGAVSGTGLHDMGSYYVFVLNEDSYPCGQYLSSTAKKAVSRLASDLKSVLDEIVSSGKEKPVFVASHIPLHHYSRLKYGDNLYAEYVFDVLNTYGKKLDIIFLYGHNHTGNYDDYIGGSLNFISKGGSIRIPVPDTASQGADGYTNEKLNFTYMNCGYAGDIYSTNVRINAVSVIQLYNSTIKISRYGTDGRHGTNSVTRIRKFDSERRIKAAGTAKIDFGSNYITGIKENASSLDSYVKITKIGFKLKYSAVRTGAKVQVVKKNTVYEEYTLAMAGDVNADGLYNSTDALLILKNAIGQAYLSGAEFVSADTDGNGIINSSDALKVLQYSVGQRKTII